MKIIRYLNGEKLSGKLPPIQIENPVTIQILWELRYRIQREAAGQREK